SSKSRTRDAFDGRARTRAARGRRHLGRPSLLLLQVPDERFQPSRGFGELPHHAIVVGALVLDPREEHLALGDFLVGGGALLLGLSPKTGQLLLARLQPRLSLGQIFRSHTILSNQLGVYRRQKRQLPELDRPGNRIVAGEQEREGPALGLQPVERL